MYSTIFCLSLQNNWSQVAQSLSAKVPKKERYIKNLDIEKILNDLIRFPRRYRWCNLFTGYLKSFS